MKYVEVNTNADVSIESASCVLGGFAFHASGGAAVAYLRDGTDVTGKIVAVFGEATGIGRTVVLGVPVYNGIYLDVVTGTVIGSVWWD